MLVSFRFLFGEFVVNTSSEDVFKKLENLKSIQLDLASLLPSRSAEVDNFIMSAVRDLISISQDVH